MFARLFGNFLMEHQFLGGAQLQELLARYATVRVKLGLIAVSRKLLTAEQAEELNRIQSRTDKRFGDIALEKGYLTRFQLDYLLGLQTNAYLAFMQSVLDQNILTMPQLEKVFRDFQSRHRFTEAQLDSLKSDDVAQIVPLFAPIDDPLCAELAKLAVRHMIRFVDAETAIDESQGLSGLTAETLSCQKMPGERELFLGFAGKNNALLSIANADGREQFSRMDDYAFDAVCDFANSICSIFAAGQRPWSLLPPEFYRNATLSCETVFHKIPILCKTGTFDLIVGADVAIT